MVMMKGILRTKDKEYKIEDIGGNRKYIVEIDKKSGRVKTYILEK